MKQKELSSFCKSENDMQLLSHGAECNIGNLFQVSHTLQLMRNSKI